MVIIKKSVISIILVVCIVFGLLVSPASAVSYPSSDVGLLQPTVGSFFGTGCAGSVDNTISFNLKSAGSTSYVAFTINPFRENTSSGSLDVDLTSSILSFFSPLYDYIKNKQSSSYSSVSVPAGSDLHFNMKFTLKTGDNTCLFSEDFTTPSYYIYGITPAGTRTLLKSSTIRFDGGIWQSTADSSFQYIDHGADSDKNQGRLYTVITTTEAYNTFEFRIVFGGTPTLTGFSGTDSYNISCVIYTGSNYGYFSFFNPHDYSKENHEIQENIYNILTVNLDEVIEYLRSISNDANMTTQLVSTMYDLVDLINRYFLNVQAAYLQDIYSTIGSMVSMMSDNNMQNSEIIDFLLTFDDYLSTCSSSLSSLSASSSDANDKLDVIIGLLGDISSKVSDIVIDEGDGDDGGFSLLDLLGLIKNGLVSIVKFIWRGLTGIFDNVGNLWDAYSFNETQNNLTNNGVWDY